MSMFDAICSFPLKHDLLSQAVHPTEPLLAVGLTSGHVAAHRLPPSNGSSTTRQPHKIGSAVKKRSSNGTDVVDTAWSTRRHKGSCRCLNFSLDGKTLYSAGTDGIVKAAESETGRVIGKVAVPADAISGTGQVADAPTAVHCLSPQTLLLSTDSGALHLFDLRDPVPSLPIVSSGQKTAFALPRPSQTHHPHTDHISSLCPLPPSMTSTSGYSRQFITTGGTTLALTDLRRGVLVKSEDQEELLLCSLYVTGLAAKKSSGSSGQKALVGGADGVITLWEKGQWDDQDERIVVSHEKETIDALALVPDGIGGVGKHISAGLGDGRVRFVRLGSNTTVGEVQHHDIEGVVDIDFDIEGRMITGGGPVVKVWREPLEIDEQQDYDGERQAKRVSSDSEEQSQDDQDSDSDAGDRKRRKKSKRRKSSAKQNAFSFSGLD